VEVEDLEELLYQEDLHPLLLLNQEVQVVEELEEILQQDNQVFKQVVQETHHQLVLHKEIMVVLVCLDLVFFMH
jgi:molybdopterin-guanine dinucleotide biosynthesis protein A